MGEGEHNFRPSTGPRREYEIAEGYLDNAERDLKKYNEFIKQEERDSKNPARRAEARRARAAGEFDHPTNHPSWDEKYVRSADSVLEHLEGRVNEAEKRLNDLMDEHHEDGLRLNQRYRELVSVLESSYKSGDEEAITKAEKNLEKFEIDELGMKPKETAQE